MKIKTILGVVAILGFGGMLFANFGSQVGGYQNFAKAEATGTRAHVVGTWAEDLPMQYDRQENVFIFHMRDKNGTVRRVRYANPKPANFEEAEEVVVEGYAGDDAFIAESILVKCPSKYNDARGLDSTKANPAAIPSRNR
ncbi:cytochrome c maturation protein CcmE domain-containing protein [Longibacter sp.]|jgi:cytochrome c-type biogenesis protein CcmE|uniref:cytochrome c maturation protein CcmE domain-containing protein n=1 Tax=Longibacter sp. TaxID=2045415 RepID=UPI003EB7EC67